VIDEQNESDVKLSVTSTPFVDKSVNDLSERNTNNNDNRLKSKCLKDTLTPNTTSAPEPTGPGPGFGSTNSLEPITISVPEINLIKVNENTNETELPIVTKPNAKKKSSYKKPTTPSTRKLLPCKDRLYDPNKHCGVYSQEMDKPCTRSLTCKTHSLTLRRAVKGRVKNFDDLLSEHREAKDAALRAQGIEVKPTKKAMLREQKLLRTQNQLKSEPNQQLSDNNSCQQNRTQMFSESDLVKSQSNIPTIFSTNTNLNTNTNSLLALDSSPHTIENVNLQQSHHILNQIRSHPNGMQMSCHPKPAAVCNYNMRSFGQHLCLINRNSDLSIAAINSTFNSSSLTSKLANNKMCSSTTLSPLSVKSPLRNANQTLPPTKKLCSSIEAEFESQIEASSDPYNFADNSTITAKNSFTYSKPKTTISKSSSNTSNKKKKKSDINSNLDNSSLLNLSNGQIFNFTTNTNSHKKNINKKTLNNSHTTSISSNSTTIPISNSNNTINSNSFCEEQQPFYPSTSLVSEVPLNRNLNVIQFINYFALSLALIIFLNNSVLKDMLNSIDSCKSDNGSILLNGSLLSFKNNSTLTKQSNNTSNSRGNQIFIHLFTIYFIIKIIFFLLFIESINKKTIYPAKNYSNSSNKLLLNKVSTQPLSSVPVSPHSRPILQKQSLPSTTVNLSQSQNMSQLHNTNNTTHTLFIKSAKQSLTHQLTPTIPSAKLLSKSDNYPT
jgi:hypothetical protein